MIRPGISTGQLLERIRDLRTQVTGFSQQTLPLSTPNPNFGPRLISEPVAKDPKSPFRSPYAEFSGGNDSVNPTMDLDLPKFRLESPSRNLSPGQTNAGANPPSWAKARLVENGLALTGELKTWQIRAESGQVDASTILDPEEFREVVQVADAVLRLIPAFPAEPELLEPLALALETILEPLRMKIASWHQAAREYNDLAQMVHVSKTAADPGQQSALAATLVRFSQKTGRLGLWLLPWDKMEPVQRMRMAEAWLASTEAFKGGVWAMHEAAFGALQGKAPPIPPLWGSWLADLEKGEKPSGPWSLCQAMENATGESHPLAGEWVPVEHPGLGDLLLIDSGNKRQTCRALKLGTAKSTNLSGTTIVLANQDLFVIRDLPHAKLRSVLARMLLGGSRS